MGLLKIEALAETPLQPDAGSFPLSELEVGPGLQALFDALDGPAFRKAVEQKFGLDLKGRATMFTLRGRCDTRDGQIHTDSKKKIITVLLYLNDGWAEEGGRLRLLKNGEDLDAVAAEVPPKFGTLLVFRRSENSWHGHEQYVGPRKVLQMNWVVSDK